MSQGKPFHPQVAFVRHFVTAMSKAMSTLVFPSPSLAPLPWSFPLCGFVRCTILELLLAKAKRGESAREFRAHAVIWPWVLSLLPLGQVLFAFIYLDQWPGYSTRELSTHSAYSESSGHSLNTKKQGSWPWLSSPVSLSPPPRNLIFA